MRIEKTGVSKTGKLAAAQAKLASVATHIDERDKLNVQISTFVPGAGDEVYEQHHVVLSDGDIERLLDCLANPKTEQDAAAVARAMQGSLRSLMRLSALGAGTQLDR
ncbi:hypothetical protein G5B35_11040 [Parapusillimonas sp. SGNA-6]|jgi:uncharacterized protein (DUF1778 family)|nr:hypothetical protein [Parapusillimonas sp. SGNA-6]